MNRAGSPPIPAATDRGGREQLAKEGAERGGVPTDPESGGGRRAAGQRVGRSKDDVGRLDRRRGGASAQKDVWDPRVLHGEVSGSTAAHRDSGDGDQPGK